MPLNIDEVPDDDTEPVVVVHDRWCTGPAARKPTQTAHASTKPAPPKAPAQAPPDQPGTAAAVSRPGPTAADVPDRLKDFVTAPTDPRRRLPRRAGLAAAATLTIVAVTLLAAVSGQDDTVPASLTTAPSSGAAASPPGPKRPDAAASPSVARLAGRVTMAANRGSVLDPAVARALTAGRAGGVVLFAPADRLLELDEVKRLTARAQAAARRGGHGRALIAVDHEGGAVRRIAIAPRASAASMGTWTPRRVGQTARTLGRRLCAAGVHVNLAPVTDIGTAEGFAASRSFGRDWRRAAARAAAFTTGLQNGGAAATAKHFPGIGSAPVSTDERPVVVNRTNRQSWQEDAAFAAQIAAGADLVMVSNGVHPERDPARPAVFSPQVYDELRVRGFSGVAVTDALDAGALTATGTRAGVRALTAGADLLIRSDGSGYAQWQAVVRATRRGTLPRRRLEQAARRVAALTRQACR